MSDSDLRDAVTCVPNAGWDERIHVVRCGEIVDAYVVVTDRYVVLVDTLINLPTADELLAIASPHLVGDRTLLVVNSHADWDHCWGNGRFLGPAATYPAPIIGHQLAAARLRSPDAAAELAALRERWPVRFANVALVPPTVLFAEQLVIDGGDVTLELIATPGHQPDHVSVWLPSLRTLLAGDAAELPFPFAMSAEDLPALRESLARLSALDPAVVLYCHAPATAGPALLAHNIGYFDRLEACCRAAMARGVSAAMVTETDGDPEALVAFAFPEAVPTGIDAEQLASFYRAGHRQHIVLMLQWLAAE